MKIPKRVRVAGLVVPVRHHAGRKVVREGDTTQELAGLCLYDGPQIHIYGCRRGAASREQRENTYLHELVHCILNTMGEHDLNGRELFVTNFANLLHQALTQHD